MSKWFLDCITDDGDAFIFYSGKLTWMGFQVPYTSHLMYKSDSGSDNKVWLRKTTPPKRSGDQIVWRDKRTHVEGLWFANAPPLRARLVDEENGYLDWDCWQPRSKVELNIGGNIYSGTGYAEELTMTIPPWFIGMNSLRWGHSATGEDCAVWIQIKGRQKKQWVWLNGNKCDRTEITDSALGFADEDKALSLSRKVSLESENKILNTVVKLSSVVPGFSRVIPYGFLMSEEKKWLSEAIMRSGNSAQKGKGWAIHELVNFNNVE